MDQKKSALLKAMFSSVPCFVQLRGKQTMCWKELISKYDALSAALSAKKSLLPWNHSCISRWQSESCSNFSRRCQRLNHMVWGSWCSHSEDNRTIYQFTIMDKRRGIQRSQEGQRTQNQRSKGTQGSSNGFSRYDQQKSKSKEKERPHQEAKVNGQLAFEIIPIRQESEPESMESGRPQAVQQRYCNQSPGNTPCKHRDRHTTSQRPLSISQLTT